MTEPIKTTTTWIDRLLSEVREFDPALFPPTGDPAKGEKILGDCPAAAKPFFALAQYYNRECQRMKLEAQFQTGGLSGEEKARYRQMDQKHDALMELFWGMVSDELNAWDSGIGVRSQWKIVAAHGTISALAGILGIGS